MLSSPHVGARKKIKVHLLAAVNAMLGPCFLEFTTGTTDIHRNWLPNPSLYGVSEM